MAAVPAAAMLTSCGEGNSDPNELSIFAASSLTDVFEALVDEFERTYPDVDVQLSFAGSQVLRLQIELGASPDLFASASEDHMAALHDAGLVGTPRTLGTNYLWQSVSQTTRLLDSEPRLLASFWM